MRNNETYIITVYNAVKLHYIADLGQCGLEWAGQGPGFHMFWYQALSSENMQGQPFSGWA